MRINSELIRKLGPCENRFQNFLKYYSNFNGTLRDFLFLEKISYHDKMWVMHKIIDVDLLSRWNDVCREEKISAFSEGSENFTILKSSYEVTDNFINENVSEEKSKVYCKNIADCFTLTALAKENNLKLFLKLWEPYESTN